MMFATNRLWWERACAGTLDVVGRSFAVERERRDMDRRRATRAARSGPGRREGAQHVGRSSPSKTLTPRRTSAALGSTSRSRLRRRARQLVTFLRANQMEFLLRLTVFLTIVATAVAWRPRRRARAGAAHHAGLAAVIILAARLTKSMMTSTPRAARLRALRAQASRAPCAQRASPLAAAGSARPGSKADRAGFELDGLQG